MQRRKERDRANAAERQVEELRASLAAKEQEISKLMKNSENGVTLLEKEQKEHLKTREALAAAQATLKQQAAELQAPHLQQHKLDSIRKLAKDFQALSDEAEAEEREMEAWHTEVEERRAKALSILEEAERSAIAVFSQLDKGAADASAVSELSQQVRHHQQKPQLQCCSKLEVPFCVSVLSDRIKGAVHHGSELPQPAFVHVSADGSSPAGKARRDGAARTRI